MDFPIVINWMSPLSFLGTAGVVCHFISFFDANRIAPDWRPLYAASHLGLFCLPMYYKKDTGLIWVKPLGI